MCRADCGPTPRNAARGRGGFKTADVDVTERSRSLRSLERRDGPRGDSSRIASPVLKSSSSSSNATPSDAEPSENRCPPISSPSSSSSSLPARDPRPRAAESAGSRGSHGSAATKEAHVAAHPLRAAAASSAAGDAGGAGGAPALGGLGERGGLPTGAARPKSLACCACRTRLDRASSASSTHVAPRRATDAGSQRANTSSQQWPGKSDDAATALPRKEDPKEDPPRKLPSRLAFGDPAPASGLPPSPSRRRLAILRAPEASFAERCASQRVSSTTRGSSSSPRRRAKTRRTRWYGGSLPSFVLRAPSFSAFGRTSGRTSDAKPPASSRQKALPDRRNAASGVSVSAPFCTRALHASAPLLRRSAAASSATTTKTSSTPHATASPESSETTLPPCWIRPNKRRTSRRICAGSCTNPRVWWWLWRWGLP